MHPVMARPRKGDEKKASAQIGIRMPSALREALEASAAKHGRTITQEVLHVLERHVGTSSAPSNEIIYGGGIRGGKTEKSKRLPPDPKPIEKVT